MTTKGQKAVECLTFRVNQSKSILDEIDRVLALHYGFTAEELDFILNYDVEARGQARGQTIVLARGQTKRGVKL